MVSILLLSARSNLFAFTISNVHDRLSFAVTLPIPIRFAFMEHTRVFVPTVSVKEGNILILTPTFVPGLTINVMIGLDLYTTRFCSFRVQVRNSAGRG